LHLDFLPNRLTLREAVKQQNRSLLLGAISDLRKGFGHWSPCLRGW